ncbi:hypothetical protein LTR27_009119 [Elasticomyces elasticus]|nr:hypothetical protein LTR27_009119 [Elasticomyces elasticus]
MIIKALPDVISGGPGTPNRTSRSSRSHGDQIRDHRDHRDHAHTRVLNHLQRLQLGQDLAFWAKSSNITVHAHRERFIRSAVARGQAWLARARLPGYDGDLAVLPSPPEYYHDLSITQQHDFWIDNGYFNDNFTEIYSSAQGLVHLNRVLADQHVIANMCVSGINNVTAPAAAARYIQRLIETSVVGGKTPSMSAPELPTIIESMLPNTQALDKSVLKRFTVRISKTNS